MGTAASKPLERSISVDRLRQIGEAFNSGDAERIASHFAEDAVFYMASGKEPRGREITGRDAIRNALAERFLAFTTMRWEEVYHGVYGDRAVSVWRMICHGKDGTVIDCQTCDLWQFDGGLVTRKDTYYKIVAPS